MGIRKDQGQTEVFPRESYSYTEVDQKGHLKQAGVNPSVPFSIFLVTKGKESFVWPPQTTLFKPKAERRQGERIQLDCLKVQASPARLGWKVVFKATP